MEHITTKDAVDYVIQGGPNIAATVTTHHLIINRNAYLAGGIRPHYYCLPVAKRETHRMALRSAVCSGNESSSSVLIRHRTSTERRKMHAVARAYTPRLTP